MLSDRTITAVKAELKIAVILIYYLASGSVGLVGLTYAMNNREQIVRDIENFYVCSVQADCNQLPPERIGRWNALTDTTILLVTFYPVVSLFFGSKYQTCLDRLRFRTSNTRKASNAAQLKNYRKAMINMLPSEKTSAPPSVDLGATLQTSVDLETLDTSVSNVSPPSPNSSDFSDKTVDSSL
jgi:hypothetical protein